MAKEMIQVPVRILDKEYTIGCPVEERDALLDAARTLNEKMHEIRNSGKVIGTERIAVMAAINLSHELLQHRHGVSGYNGEHERRLLHIQERIERTLEAEGRQLKL